MDDPQVLPSQSQVVARFLCRIAMVMRVDVEEATDTEDAQEFEATLRDWVEGELKPWLAPSELEILLAPRGSLDDDQAVDASWAAESALALGWCLNVVDLPPYDEQGTLGDIAEGIWPGITIAEYEPTTELRSPDEIEELAMQAELVLWRLRTDEMDKSEATKAYAKKLMARAVDSGNISQLISDDLPLRGRGLAKASESLRSEVMSISIERLTALNWALGQETEWDDVTTDSAVSWLWDAPADENSPQDPAPTAT